MGTAIRRILAAVVFAAAATAAARAAPIPADPFTAGGDSVAVDSATAHDGLTYQRVAPSADRNQPGSLDTMYGRRLPEPATLWALAVGALALRPRRPRAYRGRWSCAAPPG
jgi:hypothetical protein